MVVQINHFADGDATTAASARLVIIVIAMELVFLVQQVFRKIPKIFNIDERNEFVKEKDD